MIDDFETEDKAKLRARVEAPLQDDEVLLLDDSADKSDLDLLSKRRAPRASEEQPLRPLEEIFPASATLTNEAANQGGRQLRTLEQVKQLTGRPLDTEVLTLADNDDELFGPAQQQQQSTASSSSASASTASASEPPPTASATSSASTTAPQLPRNTRRSGLVQLDEMAERVEAEFSAQNKDGDGDGGGGDDPLLREVAELRSMFRDADPCYLQSVSCLALYLIRVKPGSYFVLAAPATKSVRFLNFQPWICGREMYCPRACAWAMYELKLTFLAPAFS